MAHRYFPHTPDDIKAMLGRCGVESLADLYADVPEALRLKEPYRLPASMTEKEVRDFFRALERKNRELTCFAGGGFYDHYAPAVIPSIISRSEFLTAYTPYQPEISQGTLQYIFEYQTMMTELTGLEVSNASMYDGTTATAEAMMMAVAASRKRNRVLISATVSPQVKEVVRTYATYHGVEIDEIAEENGVTSRADFEAKLSAGAPVAGVIVASPNYYGIVEDYTGWADTCHAAKALLIMNCVAADLAVLRTPGEWGADIAAGDAQSLGMPLSFGGPYLGFLCSTKALIRKMPGRIVGATTDAEGRRVFVLTLQAREQHIRRDKATSNICSNQGLMALYATLYMGLLGANGLREVCEQGAAGARYLAAGLEATGKMRLKYPSQPWLNEFVMTCDFSVDTLIERSVAAGLLPGIKLSESDILIAVTEMQTRADMDRLIEIVKES
ncbi:MAG: aminomethyl-transferring glycine dehydrogenase subunit GcvPA [Barnesiella sp.]|nr:aminomethyl-transferring glycine dehydrogenase subunit GcvPA [Barnesiella sp.]